MEQVTGCSNFYTHDVSQPLQPHLYCWNTRASLKRPQQRAVTGLSGEALEDAIRALAALIEPIRIDFQWRPQLRDPNDEIVLESATNGHAEAIITHNIRDFLPVTERFGIQVLTPEVIIRERFS